MKRLARVDTAWTADFSYVIGVITTDGNLSPDGRHVSICSKDEELMLIVKSVLKLENKIGKKARGGETEKKYFVFQFGDINFYEFLVSIGLMPAKSKKLRFVSVPDRFFRDFLRGCIDGDGNIGMFTHPESKLPQIRIRLVSASPLFLNHVLKSIRSLYGITGGYVYPHKGQSIHTLSFGKSDSMKILHLIYYKRSLPALTRKRAIAEAIFKGE